MGGNLTDVVTCLPIAQPMQKTIETASIANSLSVPHDFFLGARAIVVWDWFVLFIPRLQIRLGVAWKGEQESQRWTWDECEHLWLVDAEDVVEIEFSRQSESVSKWRHHFWIVLERHKILLAPLALRLLDMSGVRHRLESMRNIAIAQGVNQNQRLTGEEMYQETRVLILFTSGYPVNCFEDDAESVAWRGSLRSARVPRERDFFVAD